MGFLISTRFAVMGLMAVSMAAAQSSTSFPIFFVPAHGHAAPAAHFMVRGSGLTAFFAPSEVVFHTRAGTVHMDFPGAAGPTSIQPFQQLAGEANFLEGPPEQWRTGVPLFRGVVYRDLYPGIDMVYSGEGSQLKSQFVVAPGADPSRILIRYSNAGQLRLGSDGSLVVPVGKHQVREQAPIVYQEIGGARVRVDGRFALFGDAVGFACGHYDRTAPLIIDPTVSYSTLLGGSSSDSAMALAVDSTGAAYIAGFTASYDFPTVNPEQSAEAGSNDVFVAKINPIGNALVYATYIGGTGDDRAYGIAVDSTGAAYVTGSTMSTNFPVRNPLQSKLAGAHNAFVLKLNTAGNNLVFSTYLGGNGTDAVNGIALDSGGNIYLAGDTTSTNFPATTGAFQRTYRGSQDAFVAKMNPAATSLLYATYLGGSLNDHAAAIAVDASGTAYLTGSTWSTDFPILNPYQGALAGGQDAFVARISASGTSLMFSTYLGGSGGAVGFPECGNGLALDAQGAVYVTGTTASTNFPLLNPYQFALRGWSDAFISKFTASGVLVYSTYLGGSGLDTANGIAVDAAGNAYIAGYTSVMDLGTTTPSSNPGSYQAFVAEVNSTGNALVAYAYIVDTGSDSAAAIAVDSSANLYFAGWTLSPNFPVVNGIQTVNGGGYSAFVTKISFTGPIPKAVSVAPSSGSGNSQTFTFAYSDTVGSSDLSSVLALITSGSGTSGACEIAVDPIHGLLRLLNDAGSSWQGPVTLGAAGTLQNSQCAVNPASSTVAATGNTVTVNLALTFQSSGFSGTKNVYGEAASATGITSVWTSLGTWTVPAPAPTGPKTAAPGTFSNGTWMMDMNGNRTWDGSTVDRLMSLGQAGDTPVVGDWNGDGHTKAAIFRQGLWVLDYNGDGIWEGPPTDRFFYLGQAGDIPVVGDWNGDGRAKAGIFRQGLWVLDYNGDGVWEGPPTDRFFYLGQAGDVPVVGDWNGDGRAKAGIFRQGLWVLDYNGDGIWEGSPIDRSFNLGQAGSTPVVGDWTGDGRSKAGSFFGGNWLFDLTGTGSAVSSSFGTANAVPIVGKWQ